MDKFLKHFFISSSIVFLLAFPSCQISKYKNLNTTSSELINFQTLNGLIIQNNKPLKYKASIDVLSNHFSGLVVVKQTDSLTKHIVFVTELGMRIFDFEMRDTAYVASYVFEPLNKPALVKALMLNFKHIFMLDVNNRVCYKGTLNNGAIVFGLLNGKEKRYFVADRNNRITRQEVFNKKRKSSRIDYSFSLEKNLHEHIKSVQYGLVKIKIELNSIAND